jgi:hypothetical protein
MAITTLYAVKVSAGLFTRTDTADPTTATVGVLGDILMNSDATDANYGGTWELTAITGTAPNLSYTWTRLTADDAKINAKIARAENDYLRIRGIPFEVSEDAIPVTTYPVGSSDVAAEMVCYLLNYGQYQGRGTKNESMSDRSVTYDDKIMAYPQSIVGSIERYQSTL